MYPSDYHSVSGCVSDPNSFQVASEQTSRQTYQLHLVENAHIFQILFRLSGEMLLALDFQDFFLASVGYTFVYAFFTTSFHGRYNIGLRDFIELD